MPVQLRAAIGCAVYAGLRKGEILRLRWEDVDLKVGVLTVASREGRTTKNYEDRRIPLANALSDLLQQHPHRLHSEFVFANAQGGERVELRKTLNGAAKRAGIDKVTMHQLRHAFCSHALMAGADPRSVQAWMGHKDLRTTLLYAHTLPEHEHAAIQRVKYEVEEQAEIASQW
jgi:integrase